MEKWYPHIIRILETHGPLESKQIYCVFLNNFFYGKQSIKLDTLRRYLAYMQEDGLIEYVERNKTWNLVLLTKKEDQDAKSFWLFVAFLVIVLIALTVSKTLS